MLLADQIDVVRGPICRNYNIFVVNNGQGFCNIRIFEYRCYFCAHWPFEFSDSNLNPWPNSFSSFWKRIKLLFFSFFIHFMGSSSTEYMRSLRLYFQFMDCGSLYFGLLTRILRRYSLSMMLKSPVMTWPAGLYLNGVLWQKQSGGLALRPSMLRSCNRRL